MEELTPDQRIREIVSRFFDLGATTILGTYSAPFDTSKPNIHDSKADFLAEKRAVEAALDGIEGLKKLLLARYNEEDPAHDAANRISTFVDLEARQDFRKRRSKYLVDLVLSNAVDVGFSHSSTFVLMELGLYLTKRKQELESQEAIFWSNASRSPNHYARTIALRFAKLFASNTGQKPTFGTSRDGGHPSTNYGRALEEIFEVLGIKASVRHPAIWAIKQLTNDDLVPVRKNYLAEAMGGTLGLQPQTGKNALAAYLNERSKGADQ